MMAAIEEQRSETGIKLWDSPFICYLGAAAILQCYDSEHGDTTKCEPNAEQAEFPEAKLLPSQFGK